MTAFVVLGSLVLLLLLWMGVARLVYGVDPPADELHFVRTADGWRVALSRYRARLESGDASSTARAQPVILCHGLAANRVTWDLAPEVSLARHLAGRGYDVWSLELRGHGRSDRPTLWSILTLRRRYRWTFDDYLEKDLPAALAFVRERTGSPRVHWVGHSMGGILLYAHLATGGSADIASGVTLGSSVDYSGSASGFHSVTRLRRVARYLGPIPIGPAALFGAPLAGRFGAAIERFNYCPENVEPHLLRQMSASVSHTTSSRVLEQLATGFLPGGLQSYDGSKHYLRGLSSATTGVLSIAGSRDEQCPPEAARATVEAFASATARLMVVGRDQGQAEHYGHFDLIIGRRAPVEVYPAIDSWIDRHDRASVGEAVAATPGAAHG
jgi:alpha-beta hydrolase superfamily lysophospholipase